MSRRSVQRNLTALTRRGWVEKVDGAYRVTTSGALVVEAHKRYSDELAAIDRFSPIVDAFSDVDHAPPPTALSSATVTTVTPGQPHGPLHQYLQAIERFETERVRMLSPVLSRPLHGAHAELGLGGAHTELILTEQLSERARRLNPREFDLLVSVAPLTVFRHPGPIEAGITIGDDRVLVCSYDDDRLTACLEATSSALIAWARELFDHYRSQASEITTPNSVASPTTGDVGLDGR